MNKLTLLALKQFTRTLLCGLALLGLSYSPVASARFMQSDPIGLEGQSWSTYAYVNGNPVSGVDPTGTITYTGKPDPPMRGTGDDVGDYILSTVKTWVLNQLDIFGSSTNDDTLPAYAGVYVVVMIGAPEAVIDLFYWNKVKMLNFAEHDIVYGLGNQYTAILQAEAGGQLLTAALKRRGRNLYQFCNPDEASRWLLEWLIKHDGTLLHFNLMGVDHLQEVLMGLKYADRYTSKELRFIDRNWDLLKDKVRFYHMGMPYSFDDIRDKLPVHR